MKNKINKFIHSKYLLISLIVLLILLVIATGTYAWFTWRSTSNTSLTMNIGKLTDVTFNSGNDISTSTLAPVYNYTDGEKTTFSINNKDTTGASLDYNIKLNITSIASELKSSDLKYVLLKDNTIVKEGNFSTMVVGANTIYSNSISSSGTTNFTFYLYIDGNSENNLNMMNKSLVGTITVEATDKESFTTYITNLYENATKTTVTNNSITYQYDTKNSLMKDIGGNIRYYGASPNNYIYFNCSDYSNQSSSTCETWRIIGVFDGKLKLIRGSQIGKYSWDNKNISTGAEDDRGKNDWTTARLMKLLNPDDYYINDNNDKDSEGNYLGYSLYYNSASGMCFTDEGVNYSACDFTSTGIKNDETRNMIAETTYNLGGWNDTGVYPNEIYEYERGTTVYTGRPTTWTGKIALAYPSDYGYAADLNQCKQTLANYDNSTCTSNNWMKAIITDNGSNHGWLLTPDSSYSFGAWYSHGNVGEYFTGAARGAVPVLSLSSKLGIESGDGSSSNPYKLSA